MSVRKEHLSDPEVALALAGALEQELGNEALLTVGASRVSMSEVKLGLSVRTVASSFTLSNGTAGTIALTATDPFADALERVAPDELLTTTCGPALHAAAVAIGALEKSDIDVRAPREVDLAHLTDTQSLETIVVPILRGTDPVACMSILIEVPQGDVRLAVAEAPGASTPAAERGTSAPVLLADVELGVTAELGRRTMSVRELLSIAPGAVIDLDRPAGALVDLLVNGRPVARGEVVVIDEEFAIRICEILTVESAAD